MLLKNTKYKPFQGFCQPKPIHRKGETLYIASIEKTGKRSNPIDFVAIPVKIIATQITTFYEEKKAIVFYEVVSLNNDTDESFMIDESRLFLSMRLAYSEIAEYLEKVIESVEDRIAQNSILEQAGIEPIGKSKLRKQLLNYLKGRQFQAIITAENLDVSN